MNRSIICIAVAVLVCGFAIASARAQSKPPEGLDALSDDALLDELAARGMDSLLEHAFVVDKVPPERQSAIRTVIRLRELGDPNIKLSGAQRQKLIADIVKGIDLVLPGMRDPRLMMRQAADLLIAGVEREVNTLEYWGEDPRTQARLRPIVTTVIKLLDRATQQAKALSEEAANRIKNPDDKSAVARFEQYEQLAREAEYTKFMTDYDLVLAIDRADPKRKEIATKAIEYLKQFDVTDQPIRARVKVRIGKLALASDDLDTARSAFDAVIKADAKEFQPPPDIGLQYEARYFRAVTELNAWKPDAAMKMLGELDSWQRSNLPNPESQPNPDAKARAQAAQEGASAAASMLRYRILAAQSDMASAPQVKQQRRDEAVAVLYELLQKQPSLQGIIYDQLMSKLPEQAALDKLDPLMLQALVRRGENELRRPEGSQPDRRSIEKALAAANEIVGRAAKPGSNVDPQIADSAALLTGFFLDKLDRDEEGCAALLDYIQSHPQSKNLEMALDNAQVLVGQLRRDKQDDPKVIALYERFLPIAVGPPFNRKQFAYELARRLQLQGKPKEAIAYFDQVPKDDRRVVAARFFQTVALQQQLDALKADDPGRAALAAQIQKLADDVRGAIGAALSSASTEDEKNNYRSMLVRTTLLAAEMARTEQHDPKRALALLENFEQAIQGLPDANRRMTDALLVRVQSLMAMNQYSEATGALVQLLDREPGRGGRIVYDLLQSLDDELNKAQLAGNENLVRTIARDRAQLTGFLVNWAKNNPNDSIKKLAYGYAVFDAEVQRFAAVHASDAGAKQAGLEKALGLFNSLNTPEAIEQFRATLPPTANQELSTYDASVIMGLARTHYDLGHFEQARDQFSKLLTDRRLGAPVLVTEDRGTEREIDNDNYWEAVLKLIRSNISLNSGIDESKSYLKQQIVRWGDRVGGKKWKKDFEQLRNELIPGYDPNVVAPATVPATEPSRPS